MEKVELICSDCGLLIAGDRPRTDVTRYLAETSRCQCRQYSQNSAEQNGAEKDPPQSKANSATAIKVGFSVQDVAEILGDRFEVLGFLGQGGMGSVFKVKEKQTDKIFAVKLLNPQLVHDHSSVKRFEQEAKAAIHLTHAHLAAVYEYGLGKDETPYLVMDFLDGTTLDQLLKKEGRLDQSRALNIFIEICEAIQYAHFKGVIHRDIKPNNIMITNPNKGQDFAKLFDFGIAKVLPNQAIDFTQDMTQTGELYGSPLYMSPEQCNGSSLDERTDLYSMGCVMYKTLTGKHPFEGKNFVDTVVNIITKEPAPLSSVHPEDMLPKRLEQVVARCLSKDPNFRYKNAALLQDDLERVRDGKTISNLPSASQVGTTSGKTKLALGFAAFACSIGLGAAIYASVHAPMPMSVMPAAVTQNATTDSSRLDAERLDSLSFTYFNQHKYKQAIPLLEFGINTYTKKDSFLADNYSHLGKCYLMLGEYDKAAPNYQDSLKLFQQWGNYRGSGMAEAVKDYATVLQNQGKGDKATAMLEEFRRLNTLRNIP